MINSKKRLTKPLFHKALIAFSLLFISNLSFAEVPVVDDSENYALLEEQTINSPSSVQNSNSSNNGGYYEHEQALAHETSEQVSANANSGSYDEIKNLKQEVQELRGQIEVLNHELKKLKEQQLTFYKDLDARITNKQPLKLSENAISDATEPNKDPNTEQPIPAFKSDAKPSVSLNSATNYASPNTNPADEQISYLKAYELIKNKQFPEAVNAMQNFVAKYPSGSYSANAEYWLGELYLAEKNYPNAISHFDEVIQKYPTSNKYSASLLKLGYALAESGRYGEAKAKLSEVMQKYPDTSTSELARNKLEEISSSI